MKRLFCGVLVFLAMLLSGCEAGNIQRRVVVHALGIDRSEKGYEVSYQVFSGGEESTGGGPVDASESTVVTLLAEGRTLYEAEESLRLQTGKEIFLGDTELVVISEQVGEDALSEFLEYFRNADIYLGVNVVYCRGAAKDTIGAKLNQGSATAILLRGVVETAIKNSRACSSRIIEISNAVEFDGETAPIPILSLEREESEEDMSVSDVTLGVFDSLLVTKGGTLGEIDENIAIGARLLRGDAKKLALTVRGSGVASLEIDGLKIRRECDFNGTAPKIKVTICGRYSVKSPSSGEGDDIGGLAERELLNLCGLAYERSYESGGDFLRVKKLLKKYAQGFSMNPENALDGVGFEVFASLSEY